MNRLQAALILLALSVIPSSAATEWTGWDSFEPAGDGIWTWKSGDAVSYLTVEDLGNDITRIALGPERGQLQKACAADVSPGKIVLKRAAPMVFQHSEGRMRCFIPAADDERFFGLGEKYNSVDQAAKTVGMWVDSGYRSLGDRTYMPVPMFISSRGYGVYLDSSRLSAFQPGLPAQVGEETRKVTVITTTSEEMTLYVWRGDSYADLHRKYCEITGFPEAPPEWAFGLFLSRSAYSSQKEVLDVARRWKALDLPISVLNIEGWRGKPWHSFDEKRFPDPREMIRELHEYGIKLMLWNTHNLPPDDPNYKHGDDNGFFVKDAEGKTYNIAGGYGRGGCIDVTNPDAMKWWNSLYDPLLEMGVDALFNDVTNYLDDDMKSSRSGEMVFSNGKTSDEMHNLYWMLFNEHTYEYMKSKTGDDTMLRSAGGWAGQQKHSTIWAGDSATTWSFLERDIKALLSSGWSGIPYFGYDIPGFSDQGNPPSPELYIRWVQFGAMSPMMQFHTTGRPEPWYYGDEAIANLRVWGWMRESFMPYIYSLALEAEATGAPMARSLIWESPDDPQAGAVEDQFMLGPNLLIAPLYQPGSQREVYLPSGDWFDIADGSCYKGPVRIEAQAPLMHLPIYMKAGSLCPVRLSPSLAVAAPLDEGHVNAVEILPPLDAGSGSFTWRRDDGETRLSIRRRGEEITFRARGDDLPVGTVLRFEVGPPVLVKAGSEKLAELSATEIAQRDKPGYYYRKSEQVCFVYPGPGTRDVTLSEKHGQLTFADWLAPARIPGNAHKARFEVTIREAGDQPVAVFVYRVDGGGGAVVGEKLGKGRWGFEVPIELSARERELTWNVGIAAKTGELLASRERVSLIAPPTSLAVPETIRLDDAGSFEVTITSSSSFVTAGRLELSGPPQLVLQPASATYVIRGEGATRKIKISYRIKPDAVASFGPGEHPITLSHTVGKTKMQGAEILALRPLEWHVAGPFGDGKQSTELLANFRESYPPEKGEIDLGAEYATLSGQAGWKPYPADWTGPDGLIDIERMYGKVDFVSAYLYTTFSCPTERKAMLRVGSDDALMLWLNGEKVGDFPVARPAQRDQDQVSVTLKAGENVVLAKVFDVSDAWRFYFRITDLSGQPMNDLGQ